MAKSLKSKAASGIMWTAMQKYSTMIIQFISGIILARLLSPYDYGCIGMLSIFMVLAESFIDCGFGSALIQKKAPNQADYSTIFYWNLGMAAFMYIVLFFCAPAISRFYKIPLLSKVLRVQALVLFVYAFNIIQRNQLRKNLNFRLLSIVTIATSLIALCVTIFMAYKGFGVWALVTQNLITASIPAIVFWFTAKWRPSFVFSWLSFKELFSFGVYMFLTQLISRFCSKLSGLMIGKLYSPVTLGYYSKAASTEGLASQSVSSILTQVTYPLYARVQDSLPAMISMLKRLTSSIAFITFPMMFILLLIAEPLFVLLYSDKWLPCVPYFQALCLVGGAECLQAVNTQTIAAIGKSKIMFLWALVKRAVGLVFIIGGLYFFGMTGLLVGVIFFNWFCYLVNIALVSKYIGYKWQQQLLDLLPIAVVSAISALVSYFVINCFHCGLYIDGLLKALLFIACYLGWALLFKPEAFTYTLGILPARFRLWERGKSVSKS